MHVAVGTFVHGTNVCDTFLTFSNEYGGFCVVQKSVFVHLSVSVVCVWCIPVLALFFLVSL